MVLLIFFFIVAMVPPSFSADQDDSAIKERLLERMEPQVQSRPGRVMGAVIAIYSKSREEYIYLGELTKGSKQAPTKKTMFEIGSLTKPMTGIFFSNAVLAGQVKESDRVDSMLPDWKGGKASDITLKQLAENTSGLPEFPCNMKALPFAFYDYTEKELFEGPQQKDCNINENNPTASPQHSDWGYGLLGHLISIKTGKTFQQMVRGLGLPNTTVVLEGTHRGLMAHGYAVDGREVPLHDTKVLFGSASVRSSAEDLLNFGKTFLFGGENHKKVPYGWSVTKEGNLFQEAKTFGHSAYMAIYPRRDLVVLYLSNTAVHLECFWQTIENSPCEVEFLRGRALWL